ncbi:MAG: SAM-dependent methyltransferase [Gammaproteobacteria bacterium]|nr:SAM-dependent methyltransferase [Gammaproteobacteria bacterium]
MVAAALCACAGGPQPMTSAQRMQVIEAAVASSERPPQDRSEDPQRRPAEVLGLTGVAPGQKVIEIFAAGGWYAEILARVVGPSGLVFAHNPPSVVRRFGDRPLVERLANNRLPNVLRWDREPNELRLPVDYFDGAMLHLVFHDLFWISNDVPGFLRDLHRSLKIGAWVAVIDHAAPIGTRDELAKDPRGPHRIDEAYTRALFEQAGFTLVTDSPLLRNPQDDRRQAFFAPQMRDVTTDRFLQIYRK